ncbi:hypothetical protein AMD27_17095 (plasmid) [Acinetobacter sp. TGL-Y2]|uniref:DNA topoisomerase n=1 Tax=Acinetobacter sp. TGL-Y2 TaxID=1407071 RepID=UPI0007A6733A|nr:DNA topoisomerase [Acinetobacter sp. TGL-Y2]AMW80634.1 hypothetical protein AMD27_17095 [Acinetobacter sp. TGL-Y2]
MTPPTQLFNFDTLAESAISLFGVSKQDVKYSAVSLFEKGFISYPLTDQTKAFSSDKDTLHTILNQCCNADSIEFSLYSKEALSIFEGNEKTLLQNSDEAHLIGAVSGIIVVNIASRAELNSLEYALYILILSQMKCWLINDSKRIDLNQLIPQNLISNNEICMTNHIEKVGGLNNTSKILDIAPVDAEFLIYAHPAGDLKEKIEFSKHSDGKRWHWNQVHGWFKSQMTHDQTARLTSRHCAIPLIELRQEYKKVSK